MTGDGEIVEVRLLRLPLDLHRAATEHHDGITREFQLIAVEPSTAPARLLTLGDELRGRFGAFAAAPSAEMADAIERGDTEIDLLYRVPAEAAAGVRRLRMVFDEVDEYCESGGMLSLASPPKVRAYRRWFLTAFVDQIGGAPPVPWPEFAGRPAS